MAQNLAGQLQIPALPNGTYSLPLPLQQAAERAAAEPYGARIEATRAVVAAARDALPAARACLTKADPDDLTAILFALADVVGKPDVLRNGSLAAQGVFWSAYHDDLGHIPAAVVGRACAAWRRSGERWFPTPGQLLALARQDDAWRDDLRCVKGLERLAKAWVTDPREDTEDERAAMLARSEAFRAKLSATIKSQRDAETDEARKALDWYRDPDRWKRPTARQGRAA